MTRLGQVILALIVLMVIGFASMLSFGPSARRVPTAEPSFTLPPQQAPDAALAIPVGGIAAVALTDTWGQSRGVGTRTHQAIDIMASGGAPVLAAAPGRVEKLFTSTAGGTTLYVRSPDRRWSYYYAHLAGYAPGMREGRAVRAGDLIGFVGDTGNAGAGNYHLHFAVSRMAPGDRWWQGTPINPYPLLAGSATRR